MQDDEEVLDWDFYLENPPFKPARVVDVKFIKRTNMTAKEVCVNIIYCSPGIVVKIISATEIYFCIAQVTNASLSETMKLVCNVIPHIIDLDADLARASDNGWRIKPKTLDYIKVKSFIKKFPEAAQALGYLVNW